MNTSIIWYRARPSEKANTAIAEMLKTVEGKIINEQITIKPENIPSLLACALRDGETVIFVGGLEIMRENENLMFLIGKCLSLKLELDEESRCDYIFDTLRGTRLPSFEQAVIFPTVSGQPEGSVVVAGTQSLILLPADEDACAIAAKTMAQYLPQLLDIRTVTGHYDSILPDYLLRAQAKRERAEKAAAQAEAVSKVKKLRNVELNANQLKNIMGQKIELDEAVETNIDHPKRNTQPKRISSKTSPTQFHPRSQHSSFAEPDTQPRFKKRSESIESESTPISGGFAPLIRVLSIVLILTVIVSSVVIGMSSYQSGLLKKSVVYQSELAALYSESDNPGNLPVGANTKFSKLYAQNEDVGGFLSIPGTDLAQPVMITSSSDVQYYETHNFYGDYDHRGTLRFDKNVTIKLGTTNVNTIIYGNSPSDGSLFAVLHNYTDKEFFASHELINLDTLYSGSQYLVFAACIISEDTIGEFNYADTDFSGVYASQIYLYNLFIRNLFYTTVDVFPSDNLLTLITDSDEFEGAKMIVCARELRDTDDLSQHGYVIENESVLMPDLWYAIHNEERPKVPVLELPTQYVTYEESTKPTTTTTTTTTTAKPTTTTTGQAPGTTGTTPPATTATTAPASNPTTLSPGGSVSTMRITSGGKVIEDDIVEVLAMIIEAEMGSGYQTEALKAQAVAAYTYYIYSGGRAKAPSFPTKTPSAKCREAAAAVAGQYMQAGGNVPYTPYYAISAGRSANNKDINGASLNYLVSVDCSVDKTVSGFETVYTHPASTVAAKVKSAKGIDLTSIADKSQWFKILERDENGVYVKQVQVGHKTYRGNTLHLSILGYKYLRSPAFWITYNPSDDTFTFKSHGYGTGVGMSQKGANEYAKQGHNYVWILQHFYTGVTLHNYK